MNIEQPGMFRWNAPTTRTDGVAIQGTLSYLVTIGNKQYTTTETQLTVDFEADGFVPGDYTLEVRSQEDFGGRGRVSVPAVLPFTLELIANPNPPTNLRVE